MNKVSKSKRTTVDEIKNIKEKLNNIDKVIKNISNDNNELILKNIHVLQTAAQGLNAMTWAMVELMDKKEIESRESVENLARLVAKNFSLSDIVSVEYPKINDDPQKLANVIAEIMVNYDMVIEDLIPHAHNISDIFPNKVMEEMYKLLPSVIEKNKEKLEKQQQELKDASN